MAGTRNDTKTAEYLAVKKLFESIIEHSQYSVPSLANGLFTNDLIDNAELGVAMNVNQPALDRATGLLRIVLTKIKKKPSNFDKYVSVLNNCGLGDIKSDLEAGRSGEYCLHVDIVFV